MLARFLLLLGANCGVFLRFGVVDEEPGRSCGLALAEAGPVGLANTGDGSAWNGVFGAPSRAGERNCGDSVLIGAGCDFEKLLELTDSGSSKVSMCSISCDSGEPVVVPLFAFGDVSFMREAGVAGEGFPGRETCGAAGAALF